jgi:alkylated DNA nucleotide flippase Atl1
MNAALAELPAGSWTTYGDIAAIIGSHPVAVGTRLATVPAPNAHRVLQAGGTVSAGFKWLEPGRTDDPQDVLRAEGVEFDEHGRATEAQRITLEDLAELVGVDTEDQLEVADTDQGVLRERFVEQLTARQGSAVVKATLLLIDAWHDVGGRAEYGTGRNETSCFLISREKQDEGGNIWPAAIYPSGKFEIVFQHLRIRPPFDDLVLREELRQRLNKASGVDIAAAKVELRPGFPLTVLTDETARAVVTDTLAWFHAKARENL